MTPDTTPPLPRWRVWCVWVALTAVGVGVGGVTALGYVLPPEARSGWILFHKGSAHFRSVTGVADWLPVVSVATFHWCFRLAIILAWGGYAGLLLGLLRSGAAPRGLLVAAAGLGLLALPAPSYLSSDVYSYVADGRLYWLHDLNPAAVPPVALPESADPIREFMARDVVHPYGPAWTPIECAVVGGLLWTGIAGQVVGFKILAGLALLVAALATRAATRRTPLAGYADLAFVAVACHPMLLIEGPGMAHNDAVMMAAFAAAIWAGTAKRWVLCGLGLGGAAAVKLLPFAAVPWVAIQAWKDGGSRRAAVTILAALIPLIVFFPLFAKGTRVGEAVTHGQTVVADSDVKQRSEEQKAWLEARGLPGPLAAVAVAVWQRRVLVGAYLIATIFVLAIRRPEVWVDAWVPFATLLSVMATGRVLPWYLSWVLVPAAFPRCRFAVPALAFGSALSFVLAWRYTIAW